MALLMVALIGLVVFNLVPSTSTSYSCKSPRHDARSQEYFDQGNLIWTEGDKSDSIPFYRAAVRLCPENPVYWQTLGTAEHHAGDYAKAAKRFRQAKQILGQTIDFDGVAISNRDEYSAGMDDIEPRSIEIPKLTLEAIAEGHFSFPFVVANGKDRVSRSNGENGISIDMHNVTQLFALLNTSYGDRPVEFYPQNMLDKPNRMYKSTIAETLEYLEFPDGAYVTSDTSEQGAYIQWSLSSRILEDLLRLSMAEELRTVFRSGVRSILGEEEELDVTDIEEFYASTHWHMMLIGETAAGMFNHTDQLPVGSYQLQLTGAKSWTLCTPTSQTPSSTPTTAPAACFTHILQPGEVIYYPPHVYHATRCVAGPCASVSGSVVTDLQALKRFVLTECEEKKRGYKFSQVICRRMWD
eukprot:gene31250-37762_t